MLLNILRPVIVSGLTLYLLAFIFPTISLKNTTALVLASFILTILQKFVRPILKLVFLPINVVTMGLFSVVLNIFLLWLLTYLVPGFQIQAMMIGDLALNQWMSLLLVSAVISLVQSLLSIII